MPSFSMTCIHHIPVQSVKSHLSFLFLLAMTFEAIGFDYGSDSIFKYECFLEVESISVLIAKY